MLWTVVSEAFGKSINALSPGPPTPPPQFVARVVVPLRHNYRITENSPIRAHRHRKYCTTYCFRNMRDMIGSNGVVRNLVTQSRGETGVVKLCCCQLTTRGTADNNNSVPNNSGIQTTN